MDSQISVHNSRMKRISKFLLVAGMALTTAAAFAGEGWLTAWDQAAKLSKKS